LIQKFRYRNGEDEEFYLTKLELFKDEDDEYFFSATYHLEDDFGIKEIHFPKILAPISQTYIEVTDAGRDWAEVDLGGDVKTYAYCGGEHNAIFTETVIEEKVHEMTMDELEKKLGYKVKIVNKKE
jgi:hypothetical protein